jgi:hypothetical protein
MAEAGRQAIPPEHDLWPAIRQRLAARAKHDRQRQPTCTAHDRDDRDTTTHRPYPDASQFDDQPIRAATWPRQVAQFAGAALALLLVGAVLVVVFRDEDRSPDRDTVIAVSPTAAPASSATLNSPEPTEPLVDLSTVTLEGLYRRAEEYLRTQDGILHVTITSESDSGPYSSQATDEQWIDARQDVVRSMGSTSITADDGQRVDLESTNIIHSDARYRDEREEGGGVSTVPTRTCYGASVAVSELLGCPGVLTEWATTIQMGEYEGRAAIVIVRSGTSRDSDTRDVYTARLYLDPATLLPFAADAEGTYTGRSTFHHEFIPPDALPRDFFDPVSIGYQAPAQPLDCVGRGFAKYWLGERVEPPGDSPPLVMHVDSALPTPSYNICVIRLVYGSPGIADGAPAMPMVMLEEALRADWDAHNGQGHVQDWDQQSQPCQQREEITLANGNATIFMGYLEPPTVNPGTPVSCPDRPYDQIMAVAYLGETVVSITAEEITTPDGTLQSPYHSLEGMRSVVEALQPYPSTD